MLSLCFLEIKSTYQVCFMCGTATEGDRIEAWNTTFLVPKQHHQELLEKGPSGGQENLREVKNLIWHLQEGGGFDGEGCVCISQRARS